MEPAMRLTLFVPFTQQQLAASWQEQEWPLLRMLRAGGVVPDVVFASTGRGAKVRDLGRYRRALRECDVAAAWYGGMTMRLLALAQALGRRRALIAWIGLEGSWGSSRLRHEIDRLLLRKVDVIICNTTGQIISVRNEFPAAGTRAIYLPYGGPNALPGAVESTDGGYVFSGGSNNRDYRTLVEAMSIVDCPAHLAVTRAVAERIDAPSNVRVHAAVPFSEFHRLVSAASVVVLPLIDMQVSSGHLVLLHAMELGKPVIVSAFEGVEDYVTDGVDGVVVPPASPSLLATAISALLADEGSRRRIGRAARETVRDRHGWDTYAAGLLEALDHRAQPG